MTSTGGTTSFRKSRRRLQAWSRYEITISTTLLFNTRFEANENVKVGGVPTVSRLDALQRIFEHELVHLLEMRLWETSSCAAKRFKSIVHRLFGHVESNHQLITPTETAKRRFGIEVGNSVTFSHRGQPIQGIVNRIHRRATVLVPDPQGELYADQRRYARYYVPIHQLTAQVTS